MKQIKRISINLGVFKVRAADFVIYGLLLTLCLYNIKGFFQNFIIDRLNLNLLWL